MYKSPWLIKVLYWFKNNTPLKRTWHIESVFVAICLLLISFISNKGWKEYIGIIAVFFTFMHASISERLAEAESKRSNQKESVIVECHYKLPIYFYIKEIVWLLYFFVIGAWSAIAGVGIFILYPFWRNFYRKHQIK